MYTASNFLFPTFNRFPAFSLSSKIQARIGINLFPSFKHCHTFSIYPITYRTEEHRILQESIRKYAQDEIAPLVRSMDERAEMEPSVINGLFQQGLMGVEVPTDLGGSGMNLIECLIVIEEIAKVDASVAALVDIHNTLINRSLLVYGTEEQKKMFLARCSTDMVGSFCLSESNSGSDAFSLQCKAVQDGDGWRLNGTKQWISNSKEAGLFLVFATMDPSLKHKGITAFLVDAKTEGIQVGPKLDKLGIRASSTCEVTFQDVYVSNFCVLGKPGEGYKVAIEGLNEGRIGIAAQMLGVGHSALTLALNYCQERQQFGKRLTEFQGLRFQLSELATNLEAARCLVFNAAALKQCSMPYVKEAAMAKYFTTETVCQITGKCLDLLGGNGYTKDYFAEKYYRDAKIGTIYEGTSNMQLETISKLLIQETLHSSSP